MPETMINHLMLDANKSIELSIEKLKSAKKVLSLDNNLAVNILNEVAGIIIYSESLIYTNEILNREKKETQCQKQ